MVHRGDCFDVPKSLPIQSKADQAPVGWCDSVMVSCNGMVVWCDGAMVSCKEGCASGAAGKAGESS